MSEPDLLFAVRNNYYLGSYQHAISEASDLEGLVEQEKIERDLFVYRSYIELGSYELVINEIPSTAPQALQAVKLLAQYHGGKLAKEQVLATLAEWQADPATAGNVMVLLVAGLIHTSEGNYVEALRAVHGGQNLEMMAVAVMNYLKIDRVDQAEKQLKAMAALDEDATVTQLALAWVNVFLGGAKVQDAAYIYQELGDKFSWSVRLLNGSAVCNMRMGRWEEAESQLLEAFEKDAKHPDTLANLVAASLHLGKPASRYVGQLKTIAPTHIAVQRSATAEEAFDRAAASFEVAA